MRSKIAQKIVTETPQSVKDNVKEYAESLINNKINLIVGNTYIIDKGFTNSGEVTLVEIGKLFCYVRDEESKECWVTMIYRLTEKP